MTKFSVGDVVRLKSGGPKMTVTGIYDPEVGSHVYAAWFDNSGTFQSGLFARDSVNAIKADEPEPSHPPTPNPGIKEYVELLEKAARAKDKEDAERCRCTPSVPYQPYMPTYPNYPAGGPWPYQPYGTTTISHKDVSWPGMPSEARLEDCVATRTSQLRPDYSMASGTVSPDPGQNVVTAGCPIDRVTVRIGG